MPPLGGIDPPADRGRLRRAQARLEGGAPFERRFDPPSQRRDPLGTLPLVPLRARAGERPRYVGVAQDVTATRAREERSGRRRRWRRVGALAGAIAHDFRNLLRGIMGCTSVALASETLPPRGRQERPSDRILEAVKRGSGLVGQLMAFSRKKKRRAEADPPRRDDRATRRPCSSGCSASTSARDPDRRAGGVILADPVQIEQVLLNSGRQRPRRDARGRTLTVETRSCPASSRRRVPPFAS